MMQCEAEKVYDSAVVVVTVMNDNDEDADEEVICQL